jgi:hypothetical protein
MTEISWDDFLKGLAAIMPRDLPKRRDEFRPGDLLLKALWNCDLELRMQRHLSSPNDTTDEEILGVARSLTPTMRGSVILLADSKPVMMDAADVECLFRETPSLSRTTFMLVCPQSQAIYTFQYEGPSFLHASIRSHFERDD